MNNLEDIPIPSSDLVTSQYLNITENELKFPFLSPLVTYDSFFPQTSQLTPVPQCRMPMEVDQRIQQIARQQEPKEGPTHINHVPQQILQKYPLILPSQYVQPPIQQTPSVNSNPVVGLKFLREIGLVKIINENSCHLYLNQTYGFISPFNAQMCKYLETCLHFVTKPEEAKRDTDFIFALKWYESFFYESLKEPDFYANLINNNLHIDISELFIFIENGVNFQIMVIEKVARKIKKIDSEIYVLKDYYQKNLMKFQQTQLRLMGKNHIQFDTIIKKNFQKLFEHLQNSIKEVASQIN